jgi:hypothetical protein
VSLSPEERLELLRRFVPRLHFDALERWRPSLTDEYTLRSTFLDGDDRPLPGTPPAEPAMREHVDQLESRIDPLGNGPDPDTQARSNALLREYGTEQDLARAGTCYGRVVRGRGDATFLQYWLFYADNPCVLAPGRHDGDWELVQIRLRPRGEGFESTHVTMAGHGKPVTRLFESSDGGPDVFVAVDSHASYFDAGAHPMLPLSDVCTPAGPGALPEVVLLPVEPSKRDWAHWHGRWGIDRGPGTWLALKLGRQRTPGIFKWLNNAGAGESPPSPARQGASWGQPGVFELRGRQRRWTNVAVQRLAHFIGRFSWPRKVPPVRVTATQPGGGSAPDSYEIEVGRAGRFLRRVKRVSVAFWEERPGGSRRALAMHSVRSGTTAGPFTIEHEGTLHWRAAGYNSLRQRGEPTQ